MPTATATNTPTGTVTNTPTGTVTNTPTGTVTNTPTDTVTNTPTGTVTNTPTGTVTNTPASTPTNTPTDTPTQTPTSTPTFTPTNTPMATPTFTPAEENGQPCSTPSQCQSLNCVDGVCCDTACTAPNHICNLPGREGTCLPIVVPPAPTLSRIGQLIGLALLLIVAGFGLRRRQVRLVSGRKQP